jgi:hypothetical protein
MSKNPLRGQMAAHVMIGLWCRGGLGKFATQTVDGSFVSGWLGTENGLAGTEEI